MVVRLVGMLDAYIIPLRLEEEDEPEEPRDDLVDQLFDIIEDMKSKVTWSTSFISSG